MQHECYRQPPETEGGIMVQVLVGVAAIVTIFLVVVATRPAAFHVERSIAIAAPPQSAFAAVNDFHQWGTWSPYEKKDPQMKRTFGGAPSGTGATYAWAGDNQIGEGRMTIVQSAPPSRISIELEFLKPFTATNTATFSFAPVPEGTKVTWAMDGSNNFVAKAVHLLMDIDKMVGADFEQGLVALKTVSETAEQTNAQAAR